VIYNSSQEETNEMAMFKPYGGIVMEVWVAAFIMLIKYIYVEISWDWSIFVG